MSPDPTPRPTRLGPPEGIGGLRRERLHWARLYFVCDALPYGDDPELVLRAAMSGGAGMVELRDREQPPVVLERSGATYRRLADTYSALFIVNDDPNLANELAADGVHVGQDDMPPAEAREIVGPDAIIGLSTHSIEQVRTAQSEPVDYISVGPIWETPTKEGRPATGLELITAAAERLPAALVRDRRHRHLERRAGGGRRRPPHLRGACDPRGRRPRGRGLGAGRPGRRGGQGGAGCRGGRGRLMGSRERKRAERSKRKRRAADRDGSPVDATAQRQAAGRRADAYEAVQAEPVGAGVLPGADGEALRGAQRRSPRRPRAARRGGATGSRHRRCGGRCDPFGGLHGLGRDRAGRRRRDRRQRAVAGSPDR